MDHICKQTVNSRISGQSGYSLFELVIVIVIISILATVTLKSLKSSVEVARVSETKAELDRLATAIAGDPKLVTAGVRTSFGYVGDVGALPPNLEALISNPGGYATWDGPYLRDEFYNSTSASAYSFTIDAWGAPYSYTGSVTINSSGGGSNITRAIANSGAELLSNNLHLTITDSDGSPPGNSYKDSVRVIVTYPDGSGSYSTPVSFPASDGSVQVDSLPIGSHLVQLVYLPTNDTIVHRATINPGQDYYAEIRYFEDVW
ncbi:MAG: prepilin-type N-terminal cleavage/methylation domain-containing protein [bacterium]|nr:prepilin-type N-terminal cleavage/methylation domain-containing protein [bacterium]